MHQSGEVGRIGTKAQLDGLDVPVEVVDETGGQDSLFVGRFKES